MESKMISSKIQVKPDPNNQLQPVAIAVGSANNFRGIPEPGGHYVTRPLMVNAWSQTTCTDFSILSEIENREQQSQKEKELEEKIRVLEENLKAHTELLSQIHATSARTSALLGQQHPQHQQQHQHQQQQQHHQQQMQNTQSYINNIGFNNNSNSINYSSSNARNTQLSPKIVNAINPMQQASCSPTESVKYTIIAEGTGNHSDEPIEIQLAEDDGALNLNSSADSGRLEICLAPEENIEIKTEYNTNNNSMTMHQQMTLPTITNTTPSEHHFIKRRKLAAEQQEVLNTNSNYASNDKTSVSLNNMQHKLPNQKRRSSENSLLKTPKMQNTNTMHIQIIPMQNMAPSPNSNSNSSHHSGCGDVVIDTENVMVSIGPNNTRIPAKLYENMNWSSPSIATRKLLMAIFDRKVLATHSMTGKPSPAFKDHGKPIKQMLDPTVISDIIFAVTRKCNVSDKEVRNAITTKCADENKMMKLQMNKRPPMREVNKENLIG